MVSGIVAEVSNNHNGSLDLAFRLLEEIKEAGADWVKFQCYTPDELVLLRGNGPAPEPWGSQGWKMHDLYKKAQTPHAWFPVLREKCKSLDLPWFSSVFGLKSLGVLEGLRCPAYKLASLDREQKGFRAEVRKTGKPIIQSTPKILHGINCHQLYCPPGYPQPKFHATELRTLMKIFDGISYHGTNWETPAYALEHGASIVEVHVQLDDKPSELESEVSLTISDLRKLVESK